MSYFSQLGLSSAGTGYAGGWRNGDVAENEFGPQREGTLPARGGGPTRFEGGEADAAFDAPATVSYFAHLLPAAPAYDAGEWEDYFADVDRLRQGC